MKFWKKVRMRLVQIWGYGFAIVALMDKEILIAIIISILISWYVYMIFIVSEENHTYFD